MNRITFVLIAALIALAPALAIAAASDNCCVGMTGNVDGDPSNMVDIADVMALVSYLTTAEPIPSCPSESDVNGDMAIDILDILAIVDYLVSDLPLPECPGTVTDIDGNVYRTVTIGTQIWMAENLKVTHYRNGVVIPNITDGDAWQTLYTGAYCEYGNDVSNVATYGRLYNWYAVTDTLNIAPAGWHVATDADWTTLTDYLGGVAIAGGKMKEVGTAHWGSPNTGATDESGFTALPGGWRGLMLSGNYYNIGGTANFWSSTDISSYPSWSRTLYGSNAGVNRYTSSRGEGLSVRCVRDVAPIVITSPVSAITQTTAECGGNVTSQGTAAVTARGVCWSTNPTPTVDDNKTSDGTGTGHFSSSISGLLANTIYYLRAYATNSKGTGYGYERAFAASFSYPPDTVTDIDGNVYNTITIGTQVWMAQNLKVTHYRNGDAIPNATDYHTWDALTTGAYCEYNNDETNVPTYGRLYNWLSAKDSRHIAPTGWHVPSDVEWQMLVDYLGGPALAGGRMKEAGNAHWVSPNTSATNESGFSALPGGLRGYGGGFYHYMGTEAPFWSSTDNDGGNAWYLVLNDGGSSVISSSYYRKGFGLSVRCVKDGAPILTTSAVSALTQTTAECGGTISSEDTVAVTARGVCWSTNPTPTLADNKTSDGTGTGPFTSSISGLSSNTIYYVRAYATNSRGTGYGREKLFATLPFYPPDTVIDVDGNRYRTVTIGTQIWMAENLKVTHYRNGEAIPNITDSATWMDLPTGAYCELNNDVNNVATYGRLYNWHAAVDSQNVAPYGWHVPTDDEWQTLLDYLGGAAVAGGKMKEAGTTHWFSPNLGATNEGGFSALPGDRRDGYGHYGVTGSFAYFWSSTESADYSAWRLGYDDSAIIQTHSHLTEPGFSIRCVKGDAKLNLPAIAAVTVSAITETTVECGVTITSDGGAPVTARGVSWSTNPTPTAADSKTTEGAGIGSFTSPITGLVPNTLYYVRAYATNVVGTRYNGVTFATLYAYPPDTVTDIDGNVYNTVTIGTQVWMAQNLRVTHYRNGDTIPNVTNDNTWMGLTTGAYCNYDNDTNYAPTYGRLYNWYAASDSRNIAPAGWHVPSDAEWQMLVNYLGGTTVAAGKMREVGPAHWFPPNAGATNESGFTALPGGYRSHPTIRYSSMGSGAYCWSSTEYDSTYAYFRYLYTKVTRLTFRKAYGHSIRCVKD